MACTSFTMQLESVIEVPKAQFCSECIHCSFTHPFHYAENPDHVEWDSDVASEAFHFPMSNHMTFALDAKLEFMEIVSFFPRKELYCHAQQWPSFLKYKLC